MVKLHFVLNGNCIMLKLMTYKTQLLQINSALVQDPTNSGLLRLKKSLEKMVADEIETNAETLEYMLKPLTATEAPEEYVASTSGSSGHPLNYSNKAAGSKKNTNTIINISDTPEVTRKVSTKLENQNFKKQNFNINQPSVSKEYGNENNRDDFEIPLEESLKAVEEFIAREKELAQWRIGENCLALWKGNGNYYMARIEAISPSGQVDIIYETYDVKDEIYYQHMHKFTGKKCALTDKAHMKKSAKHMQRSPRQEPQTLKKGLAFHSNSIPVCKRNERLRQQHLVATVVQNH